jgi:hypothetical protein
MGAVVMVFSGDTGGIETKHALLRYLGGHRVCSADHWGLAPTSPFMLQSRYPTDWFRPLLGDRGATFRSFGGRWESGRTITDMFGRRDPARAGSRRVLPLLYTAGADRIKFLVPVLRQLHKDLTYAILPGIEQSHSSRRQTIQTEAVQGLTI